MTIFGVIILSPRGPISDAEIVDYALKYGFVANMEVTNGCCGDKKVFQSKGARTFLETQIKHTSASQLTGLFSIREHGYQQPLSKDLSFIVNSKEYDASLIMEIVDEILYYSELVHDIPEKYSLIFISRVFDPDLLRVFNRLCDISEQLSQSFDFMLMKQQPYDRHLDIINSVLPEEDKFRNIAAYTSYISCLKGTFLEVYAAKLFKSVIPDSVVFIRKDFLYECKGSEENAKIQKSSDIDVGVICRPDEFKASLYHLKEKGYQVRSDFT